MTQFDNNNNVDDLNPFFNGPQQYANNEDTVFDQALFENAFPSQSLQSAQQSNFNQVQRQTQSQSPALPQFKTTQNTYAPHQYSQNAYNPQTMAPQGYDQHLLPRTSHSPTPYDQYAYPQPMGYGQQPFNYSFNSFHTQRQPTPTQAFRPQVAQQNPTYLTQQRPPQPSAHVSQIQVSTSSRFWQFRSNLSKGTNAMPYSYAQPQRYVTPGMLNNEHQMYRSKSLEPNAMPMLT